MTSRRTKISPKSGRGLGHVTPTIFGSTVGYPSDSLASCCLLVTPLLYTQNQNANGSWTNPGPWMSSGPCPSSRRP